MHVVQKYLQKAIEELGGDVDFRTHYSGRGMYGRNCIGITGSDRQCNQVIGDAVKLAAEDYVDETIDRDEFNDLVDTLMKSSQDNMGLDMIVYWPSVAFEGESEEDADSTKE